METSLAGMNCRNKDSCINSDEIRVSVIQCQTKIGSRRRQSETRILFETAITQLPCNFGGSFQAIFLHTSKSSTKLKITTTSS